MSASTTPEYGAASTWSPSFPHLRLRRLIVAWFTAALAVYVATWLVPGVSVADPQGAFFAAAIIAVLNALLPPLIASLRLPYMLVVGFLLVLAVDAWMLKLASDLSDSTFTVDSFW